MSLEVSNIVVDVQDGSTTRRLLNDISFTVEPGHVVGITGPSGSGKSTLLSVIGCLQKATSGSAILRNGSEIIELTAASGRQAAQIRREHVGFVFQQPNLLPALTVREQLLLMPRLGRVLPLPRAQRDEAEQRAASLLESVGLSGMSNRKIGELSGGQQARVNIARAFMNSPELLLVDEPTAALDQENAGIVTQLVCDMAENFDAATLYVSHDENQLDHLKEVIQLVDGVLVGS